MENKDSVDKKESKSVIWTKRIAKVIFFPIYFLYIGSNAIKEVLQSGKPFSKNNKNTPDPDLIKKFFFVWLFLGAIIGSMINAVLSACMLINKEKDEEESNGKIFNESFWKLFFPCLFLGMVIGILIVLSKTFDIPMDAVLYPIFFMVAVYGFCINVICGISLLSFGVIFDIIKNFIQRKTA
jgi:hypothetical protein